MIEIDPWMERFAQLLRETFGSNSGYENFAEVKHPKSYLSSIIQSMICAPARPERNECQ